MCTLENFKSISIILTFLKSIEVLFTLIFGIILKKNIYLHLAFGKEVKKVGIVLICLFIVGVANASLGITSFYLHNKFILLIHFIIEIIILSIQVSSITSLLDASSPILDKENEEKCMKYEFYEHEECKDYWRNNQTHDLSLVWKLYHVQSGSNVNYYKLLSDFETDGRCCGFGPPMRCHEDNTKFESSQYDILSKIKDDDDDIFSSKRKCSFVSEKNWYYLPIRGICEDMSVINSKSENVTYGCRYEYPLGKCVFGTERDKGCAATLENSLRSKIVLPSKSLLGFATFVHTVAIFISCCMITKRKHEDYIPNLDDFR